LGLFTSQHHASLQTVAGLDAPDPPFGAEAHASVIGMTPVQIWEFGAALGDRAVMTNT